ncbi:cytochrome P450 [Streptomyces spiramyceticus]|uniref:cytochrome P450 n=1 Tax=Streptomyces spiramyceticus TaxID=299717 RepID=UPI00237A7EBC|nr:cytochrome P450 [Streptomyces spiramyceticus]
MHADRPALRTGVAPGALPGIGHAWQLRTRPLEFLASLPAYGDLVEIGFGPRRAYVVCHPELVHHILSDGRTFDKGGPFMDKLQQIMGDSIGTCAHAPHRRRRQLVQPAFHPHRLRDYSHLMNRQIAAVLETWRDGQVIDAAAEMDEITARVAACTMFAADLGPATIAEVRHCLSVLLDGLFKRMTAPLPLLEKLPTPANRRFDAALTRLNAIVHQMVAAYRRSGNDHGDVLSMLLTARDESGGSLSDSEIRDEVVTLFLAGMETTASVLIWTLHLIGQHPEIEERLQAEVGTVTDGRTAGFDDLPKLRLTGRILAEALRLYPPAWLSTRVATQQAEVAGTVIPSGTAIVYSPYLIQRRADIFPDPEIFDPERWLPDCGPAPQRGAYVPFGGGARKCPGDVFGLTEATLALAAIAGQWTLHPLPGVRVTPQTRGPLRPDRLLLRIQRRSRHGHGS